jgi:hypothetical protein
MHATPDATSLTPKEVPSMHGLEDEQSAFTLLVLSFQCSLFPTPAPNPPHIECGAFTPLCDRICVTKTVDVRRNKKPVTPTDVGLRVAFVFARANVSIHGMEERL